MTDPARADLDAPPELPRTSALALVAQFLGVSAAFAAASAAAGDPSATCGWCGANAFDEAIRRALVADDPLAPARWSHALSFGIAPALGLGGVVLPALASPARRHAGQNAAVVINAVVLTVGLTDAAKKLADRQRPGVHHGRAARTELAASPIEHNLSFFSGDTSIAFAVVAAGWAVAARRGYRRADAVAALGFAAAAGVALLRVAADMHWATDVLAGAAVGAGVGLGLPRLLHGAARRG